MVTSFLFSLIITVAITAGPFYFGLLLLRLVAGWARQRHFLLLERTAISLGVPIILCLASLSAFFLVRRARGDIETWLNTYTNQTWCIVGFVVVVLCVALYTRLRRS